MNGEEFLRGLAQQLSSELIPNLSIRKFTTNPAIIGAYAEATVRQFITRMVAPLRVSTGAVIDEKLCSNPAKVPQIDTMIWLPAPAPAIFCSGDFGLVPRGSCLGIMEIKRSVYSDVGKHMKSVLDRSDELVTNIPMADEDGEGEMFGVPRELHCAFGVVCLDEHKGSDHMLNELVEADRAGILLELVNGEVRPNAYSIHLMVNFLVRLRAKALAIDGKSYVNLNLLRPREQERP